MPATDWNENVAPDEGPRFERLAETLRTLQRGRATHGRPARALHAKAHAGLAARFEVLPDLPEHARQGLFASAATYEAYVRFSNGSGARQSDRQLDVRGAAIKVVGVPGKKIIPGLEDASTQDFLFIHAPASPFRTPEEFVGFVVATRSPALALPRLIARFGPLSAIRIARRVVRTFGPRARSISAQTYHGPAPIRFGPYAAKLALVPTTAPHDAGTPPASADHFAEDLARRLRDAPLDFEVRVQFFVDATPTPIEDASVAWREEDASSIAVGRVHLPAQDVHSTRGRKIAELVESMSFDPWHALEAHRPLGAVMRARNAAYRLSTQERGAAREPDGSERFD